MTMEENARTFYESARTELIERIGHRDNVLILYLGAVGAIYGVVLGTTADRSILLAVPYLAVGAAIILSQHHAVIGQIGHYLATELHPFFERAERPVAPQWDTSQALQTYLARAEWQRSWGHGLLVVVPALPALAFTSSYAAAPLTLQGALWWLSCTFVLGAAWVIIGMHRRRRELRDQRLRLSKDGRADAAS